MKKREIFIAYLLETPNFLSIFLYPIFLMATSPILLDISKELYINLNNLSFIFTFSIIGNLTGQLTSFLYNIKFRKFILIIILYSLLIPVMVALIFITKLYLFYILYFISGYLLGVIWIQANQFLLESNIENKNRLVNVALIFFPVGAALAPLLSVLISRLDLNWRYLYIIIIVLIILIIIIYLVIKRNDKTTTRKYKEKQEFKSIFINKHYNIIFIISILILFFYGIAKTTIFSWSPTFFRIDKALSTESVSYTLTIFWVAIIVGRIIVSVMLCRIKVYILALWLSVLSGISLFFMIFISNGFVVFIAIGLVGLGYSGIFPLIFSTGCLIYKRGKGFTQAILFVGSALGGSLAPYLTGIALKLNIKFSISIALISMAIIIMLITINIFNYKKFMGNQNVC